MRLWNTVVTAWLAVLPAIACAGGAVRKETPAGSTLATIDAYVAEKMRSARIPGASVAIVEGDRIVYLKGFGRADVSGHPVTPETPFLIGSVTKSMTALAVLQLVDQHKAADGSPQSAEQWHDRDDSRGGADGSGVKERASVGHQS